MMTEDKIYIHRFGPTSLVDQVSFTGVERTKIQTILREFEGFGRLNSIEGIYQASEEVHRALMSLDAFEAVDIVIDESSQNDGKVSIRVAASELGMLGINAGTYVQGSEGTVEATFNVRNYAGYAEKLSFSVEQGMSKSNTYAMRLQVPRIMRLPYQMDIRMHQIFDNKAKWSSYTERLRGLSCSLTSDQGTESFSYDCGWRTLSDPTRRASPGIIRHLGESMKSSASFSFASTAFEEMPNISSSTLTCVEIGGIGTHGLFQFIKGSISSHLAYAVTDTVTLALEGTLGTIIPSRWSCKKDISPCDRFHAGGIGPNGLRGFQQYGLGPMSARRPISLSTGNDRQSDALGGTFVLSILAALRFNLPVQSLTELGIEGQIFCNVGTLGDFEEGNLTISSPKQFAKDIRATIGAGVVWPLKIGQLEANICRVLHKGKYDYAKNGIQFGITPY